MTIHVTNAKGPASVPPRCGLTPDAYMQVEAYLTLFDSADLLEIRAVDKSLAKPRLVHRSFLRPAEILARLGRITAVNQDGNEIFIGVCPRANRTGTKEAVKTIRSVWADLDDVDPQTFVAEWEGPVPAPTAVIASSNSGAHPCWKLDKPYTIHTREDRERFEQMLRRFYDEIGADCVQDVSRVLRLPGTLNWRPYHERGLAPEPCRLLSISQDGALPLTAFSKWFSSVDEITGTKSEGGEGDRPDGARTVKEILQAGGAVLARALAGPAATALALTKARRITESLTRETDDRSGRDFAVICDILRSGVADGGEIYALVREKNKFGEREKEYFDRTLLSAKIALGISLDSEIQPVPVETPPPSGELALEALELPAIPGPVRRRLPDTRPSITHHFTIGGQHDGYITVGLYEDGRPGELFIKMAMQGSTISGFCQTIGTLTSMCLQFGVPVGVLAEKFAHMRFEPSGVTSNPDIPMAKSIVDYIFRWLGQEFSPEYGAREPAPPESGEIPHAP